MDIRYKSVTAAVFIPTAVALAEVRSEFMAVIIVKPYNENVSDQSCSLLSVPTSFRVLALLAKIRWRKKIIFEFILSHYVK